VVLLTPVKYATALSATLVEYTTAVLLTLIRQCKTLLHYFTGVADTSEASKIANISINIPKKKFKKKT